jgi:hypothetical protein
MSHQAAKVALLACAIAKPQCSNAGTVNCLLLTIPLFHFPRAQQPLVGHGILITEALRSHSDTPHSVGLLWKSDRSDAETSTWQHTLTKDRHPCPQQDSNPQSQRASSRRTTSETARPRIGHSYSYSWKHSAVAFYESLRSRRPRIIQGVFP